MLDVVIGRGRDKEIFNLFMNTQGTKPIQTNELTVHTHKQTKLTWYTHKQTNKQS